jgi:hypothetical protein
MWYLTSPAESAAAFLPSNSSNSIFGCLPRVLTSTLRRPRWAMPMTISCTPTVPAVRISWSMARISDSPPSSEKRFWPT